MKLMKQTRRKKQAANGISKELLLAFGYMAGKIVDTLIDWKPGQEGRWDVAHLPDGKSPRIKFNLFPNGTVLTLRSLNGNVVNLGLEAAALAISECAMNWIAFQAYDAGEQEIGKTASLLYQRLHKYIHYRSGLSADEKLSIWRSHD